MRSRLPAQILRRGWQAELDLKRDRSKTSAHKPYGFPGSQKGAPRRQARVKEPRAGARQQGSNTVCWEPARRVFQL